MIVSSLAGSVTTPNPDLGDTDTVQTRSKYLRSMDGTAYGYKVVPSTSGYSVNISAMSKTTAEDLAALLAASAELDVTLTYGTVVTVGKLDMKNVSFTNTGNGSSVTITLYGDN